MKKIKESGIDPIKFYHDTDSHYKGGQLTKYLIKRKHMSADERLLLLYVDDGAYLLSLRADAILGSNTIFHEMVRLGLNIHIWRSKKASKLKLHFSNQGNQSQVGY